MTLLGTAQDGGRPQAGCVDTCCLSAASNPDLRRSPVSIGITSATGAHLIDATRDLARQLTIWSAADSYFRGATSIESVWLTHLHLGHVDGIGQFGRESMAAEGVVVKGSAAVIEAVLSNPIWSTAIEAGHIVPRRFGEGFVSISSVAGIPPHYEPSFEDFGNLIVQPIQVPHRNEVADTHAYIIRGARRSLLHLPDHDSWAETLAMHGAATIRDWLQDLAVDVALIDATFWSLDEIAGRETEMIPHPTVQETLLRLGNRRKGDPRIVLIHLNHTNPLHNLQSDAAREVIDKGWEIGEEGGVFDL